MEMYSIFNKHEGDIRKIAEETGNHKKHLEAVRRKLVMTYPEFKYGPRDPALPNISIFPSNEERIKHLDNPRKLKYRTKYKKERVEDPLENFGFDLLDDSIRWG